MHAHIFRRIGSLLLAVAASQATCAVAQTPAALNKALGTLADTFFDEQARADPVYSGTLYSDNRFDHLLTISIARDERARRFSMYDRVQRRLAHIDRTKLDSANAMTYDLLQYQLKLRLSSKSFEDHLLPMQHLDAIPIQLASFATGQAEQPLRNTMEYEAYLSRISRLPAWIDQAIANMREGVKRGIVQPKVVITATIAQMRALAVEDLQTNPFYRPAIDFPSAVGEAERGRLRAAYATVVSSEIVPASKKLLDFLEREYLPAGRESVGWSSLPRGAAWYRALIVEQTTTSLEPEAIHAMGLKEVARIHQELAKLAPRMGYEGDPKGLLAWVRTNPKYQRFKSEQEILDAYRAIHAKVSAMLPRLFGKAPKAHLDILPEPELTREGASDHYSLPASDGSRPGIFWMVVNDPKAYDASMMTALYLHEGQPGHHFQMALQQEMTLPRFRRLAWINAFGEGWALYAETLGHEMGYYDDPAAYSGFLRLEMARAARLVVDTGLHAMGWPREKALEYWRDNTGFSEADSVTQIDRYIAWPAQALGYKIGALKIQELRERAAATLGPDFDLAAFHDALLEDGAMPLALLEKKMNHWISTRRDGIVSSTLPPR